MSIPEFSPSVEELQLATRLLETNICKSDILSIDSAIGIFKQSGITLKQLRDIWNIADKKGSGSLSKNEVAVVIRLMGWVQSGEPIVEGKLLATAGPIPFIKGITDSCTIRSTRCPTDQAAIALVSAEAIERYRREFTSAKPMDGILSHNQMLVVLVTKNISYSIAMKIMNLVDPNPQAEFDFPNFALALHVGDLLQSSKITSLPTSIPQRLRDQLADFKSQPSYPPVSSPYTSHEETPVKKSELGPKISLPLPLTVDPTPSGCSLVPPKRVSPYIPPADNFAPSRSTIPTRPTQKLHDTSSQRPLQAIDNFRSQSLEMDTLNLPMHVQKLVNRQIKELNELRHANQLLRDQNQTLQSRVRELEMDVSTSVLQLEESRRQQIEDRAEIDHLTASLWKSEEDVATLANPKKSPSESFDDQVLAGLRKEHQELATDFLASRAALDRSNQQLRQSLDTQSWLIAELKGALADKKSCMDQLAALKNNPDMRLLFLRASLHASQTALTKAQDEVYGLRQTIINKCETIAHLRGQLSLTTTRQQIASRANEMRQLMGEFISSAQSQVTAYDNVLTLLEDSRTAPALIENNGNVSISRQVSNPLRAAL